jgi:UDP-N-acetylmuramyl pentapeptide synthase
MCFKSSFFDEPHDIRPFLTGSSNRVAVLDLTHGGAVIAGKLKKNVSEVAAIDVYKTLSPEELDGLERDGIKTSLKALKASDFDVVVAPVHLDANYPMLVDAVNNNIPVLSHHAAVGAILSEYNLKDKTLIEITGTKAKTSTAILLAEILSREKKVVSHTSMGVEDWGAKTIIKKGLSITPASILSAVDAVEAAGIDFNVLISEISLGGTGCADIGVITTIAGDYKIANDTKLASDAKRQMILNAKPGSSLVINNDALRFFGACRFDEPVKKGRISLGSSKKDVDIVSFTDSVDASCNVYYEDANTIAYYLDKKHGRIHIPESQGLMNPPKKNREHWIHQSYDISAYKTAFVCATAIALAMNIDADTIERSLREFCGVEGRAVKTSLAGRTLIDNSNSGLDIRTAEKALLFSQAQGGRIVMVLGEESKEVCEGLDPSGVAQFIQEHMDELDALVLVGKRMKPFVNAENDIYYADDLHSGIELAKRLTDKKDTILSCVKCFR